MSTIPKPILPAYAWMYDHPANQRGDLSASFYEADRGGTITVNIQTDDGMFWFSTERGGISESMFTGPELAKVLEVATALARAKGLLP
jgi:hypothetical protein